MIKRARGRGAVGVAAALVVLATGCSGAAPVPTSVRVEGRVLASSEAVAQSCVLTVSGLDGTPVGETAQMINDDGRFSWPLPAGRYRFVANCEAAHGEVTVEVDDQPVSDLVITVS